MRIITEETKEAIYNDYCDRSKKVEEIAQKYGVSRAAVCEIAIAQGAEPRTQRYGVKIGKSRVKVCPKCKKEINITGARFCCYCGEKILTKKEQLCEDLRGLLPELSFLPYDRREKWRTAIIAAVDMLEREGEK